jgi:hypothetical protein
MPFAYRRSVIKDAIGKARSYLSNRARWEKSKKQQGKPGWPAATDHPTLYQGCPALDLEALDTREAFVRINVYTAEGAPFLKCDNKRGATTPPADSRQQAPVGMKTWWMRGCSSSQVRVSRLLWRLRLSLMMKMSPVGLSDSMSESLAM